VRIPSSMAQFMDAADAAAVLEKTLSGLKRQAQLTIADAAAKGGLSLRDAERGLHFLSAKYRGTLSATDQGELLFRFPHGFSLPLAQKPWFRRIVDSSWSALKAGARFVVRAWLTVALLGYALVFLAIALALAFSGRDDDGPGFDLAWVAVRVVSEALWWTFHPFSPLASRNVYDGSWWDGGASTSSTAPRGVGPRTVKKTVRRFGRDVVIEETLPDENVPFYEKVNRFVFGPQEQKPDPRVVERKLIAAIRFHKGRIGLLDVLRVTGLSRDDADPLMARLLLDYDGEVDVSDDGAITYRFEHLRKTAGDVGVVQPPPAWSERVQVPAVTGNAASTNLLIGALNAFNLLMAWVAMSLNLSLDRLSWLLTAGSPMPEAPPPPSTALALGVVPFVFSLVLFALPVGRALWQGKRKRAADEENARRAVLKTILEETERQATATATATGVYDAALKRAWQQETGSAPDDATLARAVAALGGDVDVDALATGRGLYRFRDLEAEVLELQKQRAAAKAEEESVGAVVFRAD
jgi:hypothetical protein